MLYFDDTENNSLFEYISNVIEATTYIFSYLVLNSFLGLVEYYCVFGIYNSLLNPSKWYSVCSDSV